MTDAADPSAELSAELSAGPAADPSIPELLLALQAVDTEADQLGHRRDNSPLRAEFTAASSQLKAWERRRQAIGERIEELAVSIEEAEAKGVQLREHRTRLDRQLKTVIAPREAEALMHEIAMIDEQGDQLDTVELEALEEQSDLDDQRSSHLRDEESIRTAVRLADEALATEVSQIDNRLAELAGERNRLRAAIPEQLVATYDRKRDALGVAVAQLVGKQCQGCHLELSAAEVDTAKEEGATTGVTDCPDCGRLLII